VGNYFIFKFLKSKQNLLPFLKSTDFSKGIVLAFAITLPIVVGVYFDFFEVGLAIAIGALLSSPSDVNGSFRHTKFGILFSIAIAVIASLVGHYLALNTWLLIPILGVTMFSLSYISVFGFRASLISFSGLFAIVLSFAAISNEWNAYLRAFFIGVGGLWYLFLVILRHKINPKSQIEQILSEAVALTGNYLEIRGKLISSTSNRHKLQRKLLDLQVELNEKHETLRDILISSRKSSGNSPYENKQLLVLIQLVDVLELAMANPVNYEKMDRLLEKYPDQINAFQKLLFAMANHLQQIAYGIQSNSDISNNDSLETNLQLVKNSLKLYSLDFKKHSNEGYLMLQNLYNYQEKQALRISKIKNLLDDKNISNLRYSQKEEAYQFITSQDYDIKILKENFCLKSVIFKHSLRLAFVVMIGYAIGDYFSLQNPYWILLTIVVIMRPNYGLTKSRSKQRVLGTLIGGVIAAAIVLSIQSVFVYAVLAIISLTLAFSMVQKNYKTSAVFITLSVVFIYALLSPDVLHVIQFRILDTFIGAALATAGNLLLWPSWEFTSIKLVFSESMDSNREYLKEIVNFYRSKGKIKTSYKLSRKRAFLASGNLNIAFQRMTQEPKSKQKNLDIIYELVVLNHSFMTSLAAIGSFIQNNSTTKASSHFNNFVVTIDENLKQAIALLSNSESEFISEEIEIKESKTALEKSLADLTQASVQFEDWLVPSSVIGTQLQEAHLIIEQLKWLHTISEKLVSRIPAITSA